MKTELNILQTAFRLFLGKGFSDISTNEIIREAGTTKGGFYYCFKSRAAGMGKQTPGRFHKNPVVGCLFCAAALPQIPGKHWYGYCLSGFLLPAL